jgi:hypothetical protein
MSETASLLPDGRVLILGDDSDVKADRMTAETYRP